MAFKEYGNYDAVGLAELVRNKEVAASELLDEAIARTAKVDPQINAACPTAPLPACRSC